MRSLHRHLSVSVPLLLSCCACSGGGGGGGGGGDAGAPPVPQLAAVAQRAYGVVDLGSGRMHMRSGLGLQGPRVRGMAFDPGAGVLYAIEDSGGILMRFDPQSAAIEVVGGTGFDLLGNLAFDTKRGRLTAVASPHSLVGQDTMLVAIDPVTGIGSPLGELPTDFPFDIEGLTYDPSADRLYAIEDDELWRIHPVTAAAERIGVVGVGSCRAIEMDIATGLLWSACQGLYRIDPSTAVATFVASFDPALSSVDLAFDPATNNLYAADGHRDRLVLINQFSAEATLIGNYGYSLLEGLEYDADTARLYGTAVHTDELVSIDPHTGAGTVVGKMDVGQIRGLAMDPAAGLLYGADGDVLREIDPTNAEAQAQGPLGFQQVAGLAFDPISNTLYGVDDESESLIVVDPVTGIGSAVGALGFNSVKSLAYDPAEGVLYAIDNEQFALIEIDPLSGAAKQSVPDGFFLATGLAFEPESGQLLAFTGTLERIDPSSGARSSIGEMVGHTHGLALDEVTGVLYGTDGSSVSRVDPVDGDTTTFGPTITNLKLRGLAFDRNAGVLYGSDIQSGLLVRIDTSTGEVIELGVLGFGGVEGLAFDPSAGILYGSDTETDQLIRINTLSGVGTAIGTLGFEFVEALEFDVTSGTLFGADGKTRQLLTIDVSTGAATAIGSTGHRVRGLAGRVP